MAGCELVTSILLQSAKPIPRCFQLKSKNANLGEYPMKAFLYFSLIFIFLRKITASNTLTLVKEITSHLHVVQTPPKTNVMFKENSYMSHCKHVVLNA